MVTDQFCKSLCGFARFSVNVWQILVAIDDKHDSEPIGTLVAFVTILFEECLFTEGISCSES